MPQSLPNRAHLGQLKHQAKDILRAHAKKDPGVCGLLRQLRRFEQSKDDEVLSSPVSLTDVQYVLALEYGFSSWDALKTHVAAVSEPSVLPLGRDGDAVFVRNLENVVWGGRHAKQNSVLAAFEAAASALGDPLDYDTLMANSGAAFRLQHKWCPSSPHAKCGFDCSNVAARTSGYRLDWLAAKDTRVSNWQYGEELSFAHARAIECIDRGHAVLWGSEECSLLVGYAESGDWLLRPYAAESPGYTRSEDWPWYFGTLEKKGKPVTGIERAVHILTTAVELANTSAFGEYSSGFAAYERWARELEANQLFDDEPSWFQVTLGNAHTYSCLAEARGSAARSLERLCGDLPEVAEAHLRVAAQAFGRVSSLINDGPPEAPRPWQLFPWSLGARANWTPEQRRAQAAVLRLALDQERVGVAAIERALAELGITESFRAT